MKLIRARVTKNYQVVASFTGAWIETSTRCSNVGTIVVASFTGAWIETSEITGANLGGGRRVLHGRVD